MKPQVNLIVERHEYKSGEATWVVKVKYRSHPDDPSRDPGYAVMPASFPFRVAQKLARDIGDAYQRAGCNVSLDLSGKHRWMH